MGFKDTLGAILVAVLVAGVYLGVMLGTTGIDYLLNASIIDSIPPSAINWWNFFTFDHFMTWVFHFNFGIFMLVHGIIAIAIVIVVPILLHRD